MSRRLWLRTLVRLGLHGCRQTIAINKFLQYLHDQGIGA